LAPKFKVNGGAVLFPGQRQNLEEINPALFIAHYLLEAGAFQEFLQPLPAINKAGRQIPGWSQELLEKM